MRTRHVLIFSIILAVCHAGAAESEDLSWLYNASFTFKEGLPLIRVNTGEHTVPLSFKPAGPMTCDGKTVKADGAVRIDVASFAPETVQYRVSVRELARSELSGYRGVQTATGKKLGRSTELFVYGGVFSIQSRKIDNRQYHIVLSETFGEKASRTVMSRLRRRFPARNIIRIPLLKKAASARVKLRIGKRSITCGDYVSFSSEQPFLLGDTYISTAHAVYLIPRADDRVALVVEDDIEAFIPRILPGEMFASAPMETLKAQAVAARSDIFLQLGKRHVTDPWHICSEVHCQKIVWRKKPVNERFRRASTATRGMILLYSGSYVARAPYCSTAGGHTENIRNVWFTAGVPYLRGIWDGSGTAPDLDLTDEDDVRKFLATDFGEDNIPMNRRHRWTRSVPDSEIQQWLARLNVGTVRRLTAVKRGVSGRIYVLRVVGTAGKRTIWGELRIRRLLGDMFSSLFVVDRKKSTWIFTGAGWGHGVGMSQMGAISLGRKGRGFTYILKHYYPGTDVTSLY